MGSGVIYAVIVVLWAVVLVPMWMRRHDTETEVRSVDRFSNAMGILSRRAVRERTPEPLMTADAGADVSATDDASTPGIVERFDGAVESRESAAARNAVVAAPQSRAPEIATLSFGPHAKADPAADIFVSRPRSAERRSAHADRLRRRRRVLLGLGALLVVTGVLSGLGLVMLWLPGAALLLAAGYLVMLRRYALADARERRELQRQANRASRAQVDLMPGAPSSSEVQPTVVLERPAAAVAATDAVDDADRAGWSPQSMPLPTYVTAPPATAFPRVIDRAEADGWTAQRMVARAEASRLASGIDASPADDDVWAEATARDDVFDREFFEAGMERDGFAEVVDDEVELIVGERPRRRHASHDQAQADDYSRRRASGA